MLNKVMLIGRLGRDPEIRYAANGTPIGNMRIATDESYTDRDGNKVEKTEWHTIVTFQRQAENCKTYLGKGSLVYVEGSLQTRKWQDQQGQDRYSTEIKASRVQFLDRKNQQGSQDGQYNDAGQYNDGGQYNNGRQQGQGNGQTRQTNQQQSRQGNSQPQGQYNGQTQGYGSYEDDLGPAFPAEASGMDDVPF